MLVFLQGQVICAIGYLRSLSVGIERQVNIKGYLLILKMYKDVYIALKRISSG